MTVRGTIKGSTIVLEAPPPFADGELVDLEMTPAVSPRKGSAAALLSLPGKLSAEDASQIEQAISEEFERVEPEFWRTPVA